MIKDYVYVIRFICFLCVCQNKLVFHSVSHTFSSLNLKSSQFKTRKRNWETYNYIYTHAPSSMIHPKGRRVNIDAFRLFFSGIDHLAWCSSSSIRTHRMEWTPFFAHSGLKQKRINIVMNGCVDLWAKCRYLLLIKTQYINRT